MARPQKNIDQKNFESLCALQCTEQEICDFFDVCTETLNAWCKRTYRHSFSEVFRQKRGVGRISLRRKQWQLAEKSSSMAIFLGKQYLDQTDDVRVKIAGATREDDPLTKALREEAERMDENGRRTTGNV